MINVSIIGANGYTGYELMKILSKHPKVVLRHLVSRSNEGQEVLGIYKNLYSLKGRAFECLNIEEIAKDTDVCFCCLPHSASSEICSKLYHLGVKVIDLSADFRYKNLDTYKEWYKVEHFDRELNKIAVYGLCELYKAEISKAAIVGNPGCYTTCSILPLYPLLHNKVISKKGIIIDAKSGVSGAGRKECVDNLFTEVSENFKAYAVTKHRHTSEIEEQLSFAAKDNITLNFTPHLLPVKRGILSTIYVDLEKDIKEVANAYNQFYSTSRFVNVLTEGQTPELKHVVNSNYVSIGYTLDKRTNKLIIIACLDNLVKGASGQAVQNMNIMFNFSEWEGIDSLPTFI